MSGSMQELFLLFCILHATFASDCGYGFWSMRGNDGGALDCKDPGAAGLPSVSVDGKNGVQVTFDRPRVECVGSDCADCQADGAWVVASNCGARVGAAYCPVPGKWVHANDWIGGDTWFCQGLTKEPCVDDGTIVFTGYKTMEDPKVTYSSTTYVTGCATAGTTPDLTTKYTFDQKSTITWDESDLVSNNVHVGWNIGEGTFPWLAFGIDHKHDATYSNGGSETNSTTIEQTAGCKFPDGQTFDIAFASKVDVVQYTTKGSFTYKSCDGGEREMSVTLQVNQNKFSGDCQTSYCMLNGEGKSCKSGTSDDLKAFGCEGGGVRPDDYNRCINGNDKQINTCHSSLGDGSCHDIVQKVLQSKTGSVEDKLRQAIDDVNKACAPSCSCSMEAWPPYKHDDPKKEL